MGGGRERREGWNELSSHPGLSSRQQFGCTELNCVSATPAHGHLEPVNMTYLEIGSLQI